MPCSLELSYKRKRSRVHRPTKFLLTGLRPLSYITPTKLHHSHGPRWAASFYLLPSLGYVQNNHPTRFGTYTSIVILPFAWVWCWTILHLGPGASASVLRSWAAKVASYVAAADMPCTSEPWAAEQLHFSDNTESSVSNWSRPANAAS
jgi:hypothetical protein